MKTDKIQHEILLVATTAFSKKKICDKNFNNVNNLSRIEKLMEACWNGMLDELFPGIEKLESGIRLYMWQMSCGDSCLKIELSKYVPSIEKISSIDPRFILRAVTYS